MKKINIVFINRSIEPYIHEISYKIIRENLPLGSKVVDLGCGDGIFSQALSPFYEVVSVDINKKGFKGSTKFYKIDLNKKFSRKLGLNKFDCAVAIEVIEHLENPFQFIRESYKLLKPGGYCLITTPNISSSLSRVELLLFGKLRFFENTKKYGHITAILPHVIEEFVKKIGFKIIIKTTNNNIPLFKLAKDFSYVKRWTIHLILYPFMKGNYKRGTNLIYFLKKI